MDNPHGACFSRRAGSKRSDRISQSTLIDKPWMAMRARVDAHACSNFHPGIE
jgi:hypothetical protein